MTKPHKPPHISTLVPYLTVKDPARSLKFYEEAFGFTPEENCLSPDGQLTHAEMRFDDIVVMFGAQGAHENETVTPQQGNFIAPLTLYFYCPNVDALYARAVRAGAISKTSPEDTFWGDRWCQLQDPDGYLWAFATWLGSDPH